MPNLLQEKPSQKVVRLYDEPWDALKRFPPYYVRLLARNEKHEAISDAEVALQSGLTLERVRQIKFLRNWDDLAMGEYRQFTTGCGFNPLKASDRRREYQYRRTCTIRGSFFGCLRRHPKWETEFLPILRVMQPQKRQSAA